MVVIASLSLMNSLLLFLLLLLHVHDTNATASTLSSSICCLCNDCKLPKPNVHIFPLQLSCDSLNERISNNEYDNHEQKCKEFKEQYSTGCCDDDTYEKVDNSLSLLQSLSLRRSKQEQEQLQRVLYPVCELCWDGNYPSNPGTGVVVAPGFDNLDDARTCADLYYMGQRGEISEQMCGPVRAYYDGPCGCNVLTQPSPISSPTWSVNTPDGGSTPVSAPSPTPPSGGGDGTTPSFGTPSNGGSTSSSSNIFFELISIIVNLIRSVFGF